jgi:hypothetical protein
MYLATVEACSDMVWLRSFYENRAFILYQVKGYRGKIVILFIICLCTFMYPDKIYVQVPPLQPIIALIQSS